jgi:hypothetical protein
MVGSALKKFAEPLGFENKNGRLFGEYQGYNVTLAEGMGNKDIMIGVSLPAEDPRWNQIVGFIETNRKDSRIKGYTIHASHFKMTLDDTVGTLKRLSELLDKTVKMLSEAEIPGSKVCWYCRTEFTSQRPDKVQIEDAVIPMHNSCIESYSSSVKQATEEFHSKPKNYMRGLIGALLGGIIGVIPWVIVYLLGYFVGFLGLVIGIAAKKGYEILGGRPGKAKPWIVLAVVVFSVLLGQFAAENIDLYNVLHQEGITEFSILDLPTAIINIMLNEPEYLRGVLGNVGIGLLFAFLGIFDLFRSLKNEGKGNITTIKMVDKS